MSALVQPPAVLRLREQIQRLEGGPPRARSVLPFGIETIDNHLPGGGLALGALHEVAGGGNAAIDGAAAALFSAGIAARTKGRILWCITRQVLPALVIGTTDFRSRTDAVTSCTTAARASTRAACRRKVRNRARSTSRTCTSAASK
jgi:hypothetical protein